jgi:TRAP transporter 4TM/12TM fusion protein
LPWYDLALAAVGVWAAAYVTIHHDAIIRRIGVPEPMDIAAGIVLILLVLEGTRRAVGLWLPAITIVFLAYAFVGPWMPELLSHRGYSVRRVVGQLYLTTEGIFGIPLGVSSTFVFAFVLFGALLERTGAGEYLIRIAFSLVGHTRGGPAKVAVVASAFMGTITGSSIANTATIGSMTIPLMKRVGFKPEVAGGIETAAGGNGQLMPPVMGAAAFVMAEFMAVPYATVALWALIPALLYYVAVFFSVHFEAKLHGLAGVPRSELPRFSRVMVQRGHLFLPIAVVLGGLMLGYSAPLCALVGAISCLPIALLRTSTRQGIAWRNVSDALVDGARNTLAVAMACACAGIVIGCVTITGLGIVFTQLVVGLAQNSLVLALVLTALAGIILGMGMPTTPSYIVMVALLVPAIIKLGAIPPAAHMFAFYFAILSAITPPVALAVFAAASLAKADMWRSGFEAMRVAAPAYIVPFMFVYEPSLLMLGDWVTILTSTITATIGSICLAAGMMGHLKRACSWWERTLLLLAAVLLIKPGYITDSIGLALLGIILVAQYRMARRVA